MKKMAKIFPVWCILICFCLGSPVVFSGNRDIDLQFRGQIMSAELQAVPLRLILEKLQREKGIWFKGDESVLEKPVSIWFKDLPLQEGLRRILSGFDHVLLFEEDRGLVGLFLLGTKGSGGLEPPNVAIATEKGSPSQPFEEATGRRNPFAEVTSSPENPFAGAISPSRGRPPDENGAPPVKNPFEKSISPSPENPFTKNVSPRPENPFLKTFNPFEPYLNPEGEGS